MHLPRIGTALGLLILKTIEFAQNLEGDADMIFCEGVDTARIVNQDIGIENEVLSDRRRSF